MSTIVKLFWSNGAGGQWEFQGTGQLSSFNFDNILSLVVNADSDGSLLLLNKVLPGTAYQKEQQTLIVWSQGEDNWTLSFDKEEDCDEILLMIYEAQELLKCDQCHTGIEDVNNMVIQEEGDDEDTSSSTN